MLTRECLSRIRVISIKMNRTNTYQARHVLSTLWLIAICFVFASCDQFKNPDINTLEAKQVASTDSVMNPLIPGFNPDPCIIRVNKDYYIVTSSFEWFPGIPLYHSRDLVHWEQTGHILTRESQLNLRGVGNSSGVYAPSIHYYKGIYYVLYTIVTGQFPFNGCMNYVIKASDIGGPWSDPVFLNSTGFDPALFFDDDGRTWFLNMTLDFYQKQITGGISMQELDLNTLKLKGNREIIFKGTCFGTEGPRIYKHNALYYLVTAEGGTDWGHKVTIARSQSIRGPYEIDPLNPILTSSDDPAQPLQRAGHASFVETPDGSLYMAYLASRPLMPQRRSVLGRETCIQPMKWTDDGWIRSLSGDHYPQARVLVTLPTQVLGDKLPGRDDFNSNKLNPCYQTLREPASEEWLSLNARQGYLAMRGRKAFNELDDQSMIVRRFTSLHARAETCVEFEPESYRHMAGLTCFYDTRDFIYLKVSWNEELGKCLSITWQDGPDRNTEPFPKIPLKDWKKVYLRADLDTDSIRFFYSADAKIWTQYGKAFWTGQLSDENNKYGFTGAMVGLCVQDMVYQDKWAWFDYFTYTDLKKE
jgi:xylan 1,4-beta-xylosidase